MLLVRGACAHVGTAIGVNGEGGVGGSTLAESLVSLTKCCCSLPCGRRQRFILARWLMLQVEPARSRVLRRDVRRLWSFLQPLLLLLQEGRPLVLEHWLEIVETTLLIFCAAYRTKPCILAIRRLVEGDVLPCSRTSISRLQL